MDKILLQELKMNKKFLLLLKQNKDFVRFIKHQNILKNNVPLETWTTALFHDFEEEFKEIFFCFLNEQGQLKGVFMNEMKTQEGKMEDMPQRYLSGTMCWARTNQGHNFWCKLHHLWINHLGRILNSILNNKSFTCDFIDVWTRGYPLANETLL